VTVYTDSTGSYSVPLAINRTYTLTESFLNYESYAKTYVDFSTSTVNNIKLVPTNRTVSMTVTLDGGATSQLNVTLTAVGKGAITVKGSTSSAGLLTLNVRPGTYAITINDNVTDNASYQYQLLADTVPLTVLIGHDPTALELTAVERVQVTGTITPLGVAKLTFTGLDVRTISVAAGATYSTYLRNGTYGVYCDVDYTNGHNTFFNVTSITGSVTFDILASPSSLVHVQIIYGTHALNVSAPIKFTADNGAVYNGTTNATGGHPHHWNDRFRPALPEIHESDRGERCVERHPAQPEHGPDVR
jgi:hypothetical protein